MQRLVNALVAYVRATPALAAFAGVAPGGALGPFFQLAPERTAMPFLVIDQVPGLDNQQGFASLYNARCQMQLKLYDVDADAVATKTETLAAAFDVLGSLTLAGGEVTRKAIRSQEPSFMQEPVDALGRRVYSGMIQYRFNVQRTRGS